VGTVRRFGLSPSLLGPQLLVDRLDVSCHLIASVRALVRRATYKGGVGWLA
jgi:hypothetical protein